MNSIQISDFNLNQETQTSDSGEVHFPVDGPKDLIMVDSTEPTFVSTQCELGSRLTAKSDELWSDAVMCDSRSRMIPSGLTRSNSIDEYVLFVNTGGEASNETNSSIKFLGDTFYQGGSIFRTNDHITDAGDYAFIYQSARLGNFCYRFDNLPPGDYYIDLHFIEIINTNGPKGLRVFDVFVHEEKVLSGIDIFSVVGANKPLQIVDLRVSVKEDGVLVMRFDGIIGSPAVSGIGIRRVPHSSVPQLAREYMKCNSCAADIEVPAAQIKLLQAKSTAKYEKRIQDLITQCDNKAKECYEAWMSLTAANDQLDKVRMELDNVTFKALSQDQAMEKQAEDLKNISSRYEHDKKKWATAISNLQDQVELMKKEHFHLSLEAHECADSIPELNKMVFAVEGLVAQCEDLKVKYNEEQAKRKKLFNEVQEAKGNIRVFCRCRPLSKNELAAGCTTVVDFDAVKDGCLGIITSGSTKKSFRFDRVYTPKDDQADVFVDALPMAISVLDGYNVCIFAYGQTGTGKTFTMEGTQENRGVNYRTLEQLFKISEERSETFTYDISVSVLEVYNEQIRDLLAMSPTTKKLEIKQASEGSHHVPGIVEAKVCSIKEVWSVMQAGSNARAIGSNHVNEHSSRSHCLLCVMVRGKNLISGECTKSKLWLVDLAGSERLAKTDAQGERLKEAQNINRSLSALGDVISALANKSSHIPYRNSKLTHLLQDSLGGDSKTLMFVQISPSEQDLGETISSLNFATRVRGIELGPAKKQIDTSELQKMKVMLEKARQEVKSKDESLRKIEESFQNLESKAKGKDNVYKNQQDKINELESQLELKTNLHNNSEKQGSQISDKLKEREEICCTLQQKVKELESKLRERKLSESTSLEQKIKDLEDKLKDQVHESESHSAILQQKIRDLERRLKEQEQNPNSLLHEKIKELEDKLREQERKKHMQCNYDCYDAIRASPVEGRSWTKEEFMSDVDAGILRISNSFIRPMSRESTRGSDSIHETRRKREFKSGETENINMMSSSWLNDKKARKSDPPKLGRVVRTAKPATAAQGPLIHKRIIRDQVQGNKERDTKKKIWSR